MTVVWILEWLTCVHRHPRSPHLSPSLDDDLADLGCSGGSPGWGSGEVSLISWSLKSYICTRGAPSCQFTVHAMTPAHQWAHSMFMFLTVSPPRLTHGQVWFRSSVFPFLLQTSPSSWYKLFCPNMILDVCANYCNYIINKSLEDCKSIHLQRNNFLSMC